MKQKKSETLCKSVLMASVLTLTAGVAAGCGGGAAATNDASKPAAGGDASKPAAPYKMSIMLPSFNPEPMSTDGEIFKKIQSVTNTELKFNWVPSATYSDKLSATVASGELPSVITVLNQKAPFIVNSVRSGMFWELGPYLKEYKNLSRMNPIALNAISIDGKVYGIYRERDLARDGITLRKDWLDNLGLKEPNTIDEFYNVMKAFTLNDPDKNGKNDTIGLVEQQEPAGWRTMLAWHGGPADWEIKDGKASPAHLSPAYMETMKFYKKLYDEKLMNLDFAVVKDGRQVMNKGTAGAWVANLNDANGIEEQAKKVDPKAKMTLIGALEGPKGKRTIAGSGSYGIFMIPKTSVKTEAEVKQILNYFDKLSDKEMQNMLYNGIEGRQYTVENGEYKKTTDPKMLVEYGMGDSSQLAVLRDEVTTYGSELVHQRDKVWKENAKIAIENPVNAFISDTYSEKGKELDKLIADARTKFIMGAIDENAWKKVTEQWMQNGGSKIIEEYTAEYNKAAKK
ncbi:extracellular solute-binding protein [Paenibacillus sp. GD4]|uniref:extracellular solute-binding protein n=1 Tax=Paenibacillus sp. GD4 TaxID=3068890 RepID=UPI0027966E73|nr:extracellular solute-binding protein [Paenibacillus sp. GD4]MDQ1910782.1 extracellular solute-binding protein [Paenibacillus sp. GD4]